MNKEKQIEEMAEIIDRVQDYGLATESPPEQWLVFDNKTLAQYLYENDYRKSSDVAREIIDDLESQILPSGKGLYAFPVITHEFIAELKKKYTKEE